MHSIPLLNLLLHFDVELAALIQQYGHWIYLMLFAIVFAETGLVITPFLPGDTLLFIVGAFCAAGQLDPGIAFSSLLAAAVLGNMSNFAIGRAIGHRVFGWRHSRWFNRHAFDRAHALYVEHGGVIVVSTRFIPFVRTFAPFVAGVAEMPMLGFLLYNLLGGVLWIGSLGLLGYAFGNLPWLRHSLGLLAIGVAGLSLLPVAWGWWRSRASAA